MYGDDVMNKVGCFIDDCRNLVSLIVRTYPDWTFLCADHRDIYEPSEYLKEEVIYDARV